MAAPAAVADTSSLAGKWTYRSYNNTTELVGGEAAKVLALIFGEGIFTFEIASEATLRRSFDMGATMCSTSKA